MQKISQFTEDSVIGYVWKIKRCSCTTKSTTINITMKFCQNQMPLMHRN